MYATINPRSFIDEFFRDVELRRYDATFDYALSCDAVFDPDNCLVDLKGRVFDPACLVVDLDDPAVAADPDGYFAAMPIVNRAMRVLMITEPARPSLLRYAGALLSDGSGAACSAVGPNGQAAPHGMRTARRGGHSASRIRRTSAVSWIPTRSVTADWPRCASTIHTRRRP